MEVVHWQSSISTALQWYAHEASCLTCDLVHRTLGTCMCSANGARMQVVPLAIKPECSSTAVRASNKLPDA